MPFEHTRVQTSTDAIDAMSKMVYSIPQDVAYRTDAITVMPGLGEHWRVTDAVDAWESTPAPRARYLLISGTNSAETSQDIYTLENLQEDPVFLHRVEGVRVQGHADNAPHQAEWLADQVEELGVTSAAVYVSPYHLLRATLTIAKTFKTRGLGNVPVYPIPVAVPPDTIVPETGKNSWQSVPGENERIRKYSEPPFENVMTLPELQDYVRFLWSHHDIIRTARAARRAPQSRA